MINKKVFFMALILIFTVVSISSAEGVKLTADQMYFDTKTSLLEGTGNVVLQRGDLKVTSDRCEGDYKGNIARMWKNVHGYGDWNGQEVDFSCEEFKADLNSPETFSMTGSLKGRFGSRTLECREAVMSGEKFVAEKVSKFEEKTEGVSLSCSRIKGFVTEKALSEFIAEGKVKLNVINKKDSTVTRITGGKAIYSKERGSIIVSGGAVAVQRGRRVTAKNVVFYPATNKIEAKGKPQITFDVK